MNFDTSLSFGWSLDTIQEYKEMYESIIQAEDTMFLIRVAELIHKQNKKHHKRKKQKRAYCK